MLSVMHFEKVLLQQITAQNDKMAQSNNNFTFSRRFGCFQVRFNDILPVVNSKKLIITTIY